MEKRHTSTNITMNEEEKEGDIFHNDKTQSEPFGDEMETNLQKHEGSGKTLELSPLDEVKKKALEKQIKKDEAKTSWYKFLPYVISIFLTITISVLTIYLGQFTHYLTKVSEPLGEITADMEHNQRDIQRIEQDIRDLRYAFEQFRLK